MTLQQLPRTSPRKRTKLVTASVRVSIAAKPRLCRLLGQSEWETLVRELRRLRTAVWRCHILSVIPVLTLGYGNNHSDEIPTWTPPVTVRSPKTEGSYPLFADTSQKMLSFGLSRSLCMEPYGSRFRPKKRMLRLWLPHEAGVWLQRCTSTYFWR